VSFLPTTEKIIANIERSPLWLQLNLRFLCRRAEWDARLAEYLRRRGILDEDKGRTFPVPPIRYNDPFGGGGWF
jgi:hypothetical protein